VLGHASHDRRRYVIDVVRAVGIVGRNDLKAPDRAIRAVAVTHISNSKPPNMIRGNL